MATSIALDRSDAASAPQSLWRNHDFNLLWAGQSISVVGTGLTQVALPLTAVLTLHAGPTQLGYLGASEFAAALAFVLLAGTFADRGLRRRQMVLADIGRAAALAVIPALALSGHLSMAALYAVGAVTGALAVLFDVAYGAYLPWLLSGTQLVGANSRLQGSASAGGIIGQTLAGALVTLFRPVLVLLGDAASFLVSAATLVLIRNRETAAAEPGQPGLRGIFADARDGVRFISGHPILRALALNALATNMLTTIVLTLFPLYVVRTLGLPPWWLGVIYASGGVGGFIAATFVSRLVDRIGFGRILLGSNGIFRVAIVAIPLVRGPEFVVGPLLCAAEFTALYGVLSANITSAVLKQTVTPDRMQGRVGAAVRLAMQGFVPVAAVIAGSSGAAIGVHATLWAAAAAMPLTYAFVLLSPLGRVVLLDDLRPTDDESSADLPEGAPA